MKRSIQKLILFALFLTGLSACTKDNKTQNTSYNWQGKGVFVCNEGNFMCGNASLTHYGTENKSADNQAFFNTNGFPLGDVCQSMTIYGGKGFVVVNNSGVIYLIDLATGKWTGKVEALTSPRYIEFVDDTKAYISDLYSPTITIINPTTLQKTGSIEIGYHTAMMDGKPSELVCGTEQMVRYGDFVYVCSWSHNERIYKIDTRTDKVVASLRVNKQPNSIVLDKNGKIWVLSDGSYPGSPYGQQIAALTRIDTETFSIEQIFEFPDMAFSPSELCTNGNKDALYFICNSGKSTNEAVGSGVFQMGIEQTALPALPFIAENGRLFYALGVDPQTSEVYVSDAVDFSQKGYVLRFDSSGVQRDKFRADICPGAFCFTQ